MGNKMVDRIMSVAVVALGITALGIALRPGAPTAKVISSAFSGFAKVQKAAYGPQ